MILTKLGSTCGVDLTNDYKIHVSECQACMDRILNSFLHLIQGVYVMSTERSETNGSITSTSPASMPFIEESGAFQLLQWDKGVSCKQFSLKSRLTNMNCSSRLRKYHKN
jgi:hypothetical protein